MMIFNWENILAYVFIFCHSKNIMEMLYLLSKLKCLFFFFLPGLEYATRTHLHIENLLALHSHFWVLA